MWVPQNQRPEDSSETLRSFQQSESYPLYKQQMPVCTPTTPTVDWTETYVFGKKNVISFHKSFENIISFCYVNCSVSLILLPLLPFHFFFSTSFFIVFRVPPFLLAQFKVHVPVQVGEYQTKQFWLCWEIKHFFHLEKVKIGFKQADFRPKIRFKDRAFWKVGKPKT